MSNYDQHLCMAALGLAWAIVIIYIFKSVVFFFLCSLWASLVQVLQVNNGNILQLCIAEVRPSYTAANLNYLCRYGSNCSSSSGSGSACGCCELMSKFELQPLHMLAGLWHLATAKRHLFLLTFWQLSALQSTL